MFIANLSFKTPEVAFPTPKLRKTWFPKNILEVFFFWYFSVWGAGANFAKHDLNWRDWYEMALKRLLWVFFFIVIFGDFLTFFGETEKYQCF